ncbi:hypothetical protein SEPCBS119000_003145 [Sporothrix epigloea]|uniref:C2H2-type domain-containing protein n=1 Tax=Sporothrix epigloea TaxID=1892477 RepID=A0ABP0DLC5_9PEZI
MPRFSVLYGYQGAVGFKSDDRSSFTDAVVRLIGSLRCIDVIFLANTILGLNRAHSISVRANDTGIDPSCFEEIIEYMSRPSVIASGQVPFVYSLNDRFPAHHYQPIKDKSWPGVNKDDGLAYCTLADDSGLTAVHRSDVAYIIVPPPFQAGSSGSDQTLPVAANEYRERMMLVARILTPGAGLAILEKGDLGLIAHSRFGLLDRNHPSDATAPLFLTHGGMGFTQAEWDDLAHYVHSPKNISAALGGYTRVRFVMRPLASHSVGIFLAGVNGNIGPDDGQLSHASTPTSIRAGLASRIDRLVESATTPDERAQLTGIDIWPNGMFWDPVSWHDKASIAPCTEESLKRIVDQPAVAPSVITIRPRYAAYTAHIVDNRDNGAAESSKSFTFELDGLLESFLAAVNRLLPSKVPGTGDSSILPPSLWIRQREGSNRPEFYVSENTTGDEWREIRYQIVGPEIWIQPLYPSRTAGNNATSNLNSPFWGLRHSYHNFQSAKYRELFVYAVYAKKPPLHKQSPSVHSDFAFEDYFNGLDVCTLCGHIFDSDAIAKKKLRHMVDAHEVLQKKGSVQSKAILGASHENNGQDLRDNGTLQTTPPRKALKRKIGSPHDTDSSYGLPEAKSASRPSAARPAAVAKKRRSTFRGARDTDSTYRPQSEGSDDDGDHDLGSAKLSTEDLADEEQPKKKRRSGVAAKKRVDDPTYRPQSEGSDDDGDHDLGSAKLSTEDLADEEQPKKKRRSGVAAKKRVDDPTYRPQSEGSDDDGDHDLGSAKLSTEDLADEEQPKKKRRSGVAAKKRVDDPTYRPQSEGSDDDADHDLGSAKLSTEDLADEEQPKKKRRSGVAAKKRADDPTYRPGSDIDDDEDDEVGAKSHKAAAAPTKVKGSKSRGRTKKASDGQIKGAAATSVSVKHNESPLDGTLDAGAVRAAVRSTDGQTERTNQTLEQYLCADYSQQQDDGLVLVYAKYLSILNLSLSRDRHVVFHDGVRELLRVDVRS